MVWVLIPASIFHVREQPAANIAKQIIEFGFAMLPWKVMSEQRHVLLQLRLKQKVPTGRKSKVCFG